MIEYLKASAKHGWCLSNLVSFLRINLLVKHDLREIPDKAFEPPPKLIKSPNIQYSLFDWGLDS